MALFIFMQKSDGEIISRTFHMDSDDHPLDKVISEKRLALNVVEVQANGDEYDYILRHFEHIPKVTGYPVSKTISYFGDTAKFIVSNW